MNQYEAIDLSCNYDERYVDVATRIRNIRIPFYEINQINVFQHRIGIWYKSGNVAVLKGEAHIIRKKQKELEKTGISMRNAT